jgi:hypothetical protein
VSRIATRESSQSVERIGSEESPLNPPDWLLVVSLALAASGGVRGEEPDGPREPPKDKLSFGIGLHYLKSCLCRRDSGAGVSLEVAGEYRHLLLGGSIFLGTARTNVTSVSMQAAYLFGEGAIAPYAGAGVGWIQEFDLEFYGARGVAPSAGVGVLFFRDKSLGRIAIGLEAVFSTFLRPDPKPLNPFGFVVFSIRLML